MGHVFLCRCERLKHTKPNIVWKVLCWVKKLSSMKSWTEIHHNFRSDALILKHHLICHVLRFYLKDFCDLQISGRDQRSLYFLSIHRSSEDHNCSVSSLSHTSIFSLISDDAKWKSAGGRGERQTASAVTSVQVTLGAPQSEQHWLFSSPHWKLWAWSCQEENKDEQKTNRR